MSHFLRQPKLYIGLIILVTGLGAFTYRVAHSQNVPPAAVSVTGGVELLPTGDQNNNGRIDAGDTVTFKFTVTNPTTQEYKFTELQTGIDKDLYYDFWNLRGTVNMSDHNNTITFPNLLIPPQAEVTIGLEATLKYFTQGSKEITLAPKLVDSAQKVLAVAGQPLAKANQAPTKVNVTVSAFEGPLPPWIAIDDSVPSVSPTPTTSPSTLPSVSPSPSLSPSLEISPTPYVTP